ncbi:hypothetical protein FQA47_003699 [Oryzias melastigma]|uniref:Uncharacterized protein n=1 Tax=Oryzias melastigma TaxID=30732 RepID=A0A834FME3_ORYME|nr:hypothetical protein FQA47_003699 [Oryzias melastigma]
MAAPKRIPSGPRRSVSETCLARWIGSSFGWSTRPPCAKTWMKPRFAGALTLPPTSRWRAATSSGRASRGPECRCCTGAPVKILDRSRSRQETRTPPKRRRAEVPQREKENIPLSAKEKVLQRGENATEGGERWDEEETDEHYRFLPGQETSSLDAAEIRRVTEERPRRAPLRNHILCRGVHTCELRGEGSNTYHRSVN